MKRKLSFIFVLLCCLSVFLGCSNKQAIGASSKVATTISQEKTSLPASISSPSVVNGTGTIEVAFSPSGGATDAVVKAIGEAKKTIKVQAYSFTSTPIAKALLSAKTKGVDVQIILDKSQESEQYSSLKFFTNNNIPVKIDSDFQIAHNKVIIIDDVNVVTGSFNFTKSAEKNNAENVLIIRGNNELAKKYLDNWQWRWDSTTSAT